MNPTRRLDLESLTLEDLRALDLLLGAAIAAVKSAGLGALDVEVMLEENAPPVLILCPAGDAA